MSNDENNSTRVQMVPRYQMTIKVTKPSDKGIREVYGEFTVAGDTQDEFKQSLQFAMKEFMNQIN